jgi:hypothetical protein
VSMTEPGGPPSPTDQAPPPLAQRKARLEAEIEQQRVDLLVAASRWQEASRPIDAAFHELMRFKAPLIAVGGLLLYRGTRHPGSVARLGRNLTAATLLASRARRLWRLLR